jgi:hypothetical protein
LPTDLNLSNGINATDVSLAKNTISSSGSGSAPTVANGGKQELSGKVQTNIPDLITGE